MKHFFNQKDYMFSNLQALQSFKLPDFRPLKYWVHFIAKITPNKNASAGTYPTDAFYFL